MRCVYVWIQPVQHFNKPKNCSTLVCLNNREMDATPAVSTLHTQGSKAWTGFTKDQKKKKREKKMEVKDKTRSQRKQRRRQKGRKKNRKII